MPESKKKQIIEIKVFDGVKYLSISDLIYVFSNNKPEDIADFEKSLFRLKLLNKD